LSFQPEIQVLFMSGCAKGLPDMKLPPGALLLRKQLNPASVIALEFRVAMEIKIRRLIDLCPLSMK